MKILPLVLQKYICQQPISLLLIVAIWIICLVPIPDTPLKEVKFIDKWVHLVMYGSLGVVLLTEYGRRKKKIQWARLLFFSLLMPIVMSGMIELAQAYLTRGIRSGEWIDFVANVVGAILGFLIGIPLVRFLSTRNKGDQP